MSEKAYISVALEIFDLHHSLGHSMEFEACAHPYCRQSVDAVREEAWEVLRRSRENTGSTAPQVMTVKLRPGGSDWVVTEPGAPCTTRPGFPWHTIGEHLEHGKYAGVPLNHSTDILSRDRDVHVEPECEETDFNAWGDHDGPVHRYQVTSFLLGKRPGETILLCRSHRHFRQPETTVLAKDEL